MTKQAKSKDKFTEPIDSSSYKRLKITLDDKPEAQLSEHFRKTSEFIHTARYVDKGNILAWVEITFYINSSHLSSITLF